MKTGLATSTLAKIIIAVITFLIIFLAIIVQALPLAKYGKEITSVYACAESAKVAEIGEFWAKLGGVPKFDCNIQKEINCEFSRNDLKYMYEKLKRKNLRILEKLKSKYGDPLVDKRNSDLKTWKKVYIIFKIAEYTNYVVTSMRSGNVGAKSTVYRIKVNCIDKDIDKITEREITEMMYILGVCEKLKNKNFDEKRESIFEGVVNVEEVKKTCGDRDELAVTEYVPNIIGGFCGVEGLWEPTQTLDISSGKTIKITWIPGENWFDHWGKCMEDTPGILIWQG